jgi:hypothetical protein
MTTREEVIQRLEQTAEAIVSLKKTLENDLPEAPAVDPTQAFLEKCQGWEDSRSAEEIVAEIYAARTVSERDRPQFDPTLTSKPT